MLDTTLTGVRERGLQAARARLALPVGLGEALGLFIILRVSFGLVAVMLSAMQQIPGPCFQYGFDDWATKPELLESGIGFQAIGAWERWDACWYLRIATHGYGRYDGGEPTTAFFPLYPALTRGVGELLGGRIVLGGSVVASLAYIAAITGLYRLVLRDFDRDTARRTALYISVFPTAFFFFAPFTEALFLAAAVWAIDAARQRRWALAGLVALLAGLTRVQGAVLLLPLTWEAWRDLRHDRGLSFADRRFWLGAVRVAPVVVAPVAAVGLFFVYSSTEGGMSFLEAQERNWGSLWRPPWEVVRIAWDWSFNATDGSWPELRVINAFNLFTLLGFIALLLAAVRRLPLSYTLFAAPQLVLIACRVNPTPLTSTARYLLVLFPVFVVIALFGRHRWVDQAWLVFSLILLGFFTVAFLRNTFIA